MKNNVHVNEQGEMTNWLADTFWQAKREFERKQEFKRQREIRTCRGKSKENAFKG